MKRTKADNEKIDIEQKRIWVYGIVQGVGFRPNTVRLAEKTGVSGTVSNRGPYVEIIARGTKTALDNFILALKKEKPSRAVILKLDIKDMDVQKNDDGFQIIESTRTEGEIFIPPDIAICDECEQELYTPENRRYLHPFINCTSCGPRFSILEELPYDRERTSMSIFPMCEKCREEYEKTKSRRYDSQPVCCNECGPEVYIADDPEIRGRNAILRVREVLRNGGIAAVKGIGGFHLCCDASDRSAVMSLRNRKHRPVKPFAVMAADAITAERECRISSEEKEILTGHQKPILLLDKKYGGRIVGEVAPDNQKIGIMLPYAPIHLLLFHYNDGKEMPDVLVMTSGNISGAPICCTDEEAIEELSSIADVILSNNREIRTRADDTVMDFYDGKPYMVRRSRGYAPLPFLLSGESDRKVLAVGGELKNTFCIAKGTTLYPSAYVGDMEDKRSGKALRDAIVRMEHLLQTRAEIVVSDLHPKYHSSQIAEEIAEKRVIPHLRIQHHQAHILSCMAENDWNEPVLGVAFDGTGYGTDGTIWGGEILQVNDLGDIDVKRLSHISPFLMTGGDRAVREGWRIAVSMLSEVMKSETIENADISTEAEKLGLCSRKEAEIIRKIKDSGISTVISTSAGRLFDSVSAVLGICRVSTFEGEAAIKLENAAESFMNSFCRSADQSRFQRAINNISGMDEELEDSWKLFKRLCMAVIGHEKTDTGLLAYAFHKGIASQIENSLQKASRDTGINTVALSGGVFQNRLLLRLTDKLLRENGFRVILHSMIPPNDGGIALGQAAAAVYGRESFKNGFSTEF